MLDEKAGWIFWTIVAIWVSLRLAPVQLMWTSVVLPLRREHEQPLMTEGAGQRHVSNEKEEKSAPFWHVPLTNGLRFVLDRNHFSEAH